MQRAFEKKPEEVRRWLGEEYLAISQQAKCEKALVFLGDEVGMRTDHGLSRTYSLQGQTPVVSVISKSFGCNMFFSITNQGQLNFMVFKGRFVA